MEMSSLIPFKGKIEESTDHLILLEYICHFNKMLRQ